MRRISLALVGFALTLALAACAPVAAESEGTAPPSTQTAAGPSEAVRTQEPTSAAPATPAPTQTPTPTCSDLTGTEAFELWSVEIPPPILPDSWVWAAYYADETYDPCADLSWIVITHKSATGSTPCQIMLFHRGEYLGTATWLAYEFTPSVARLDDQTIEVTYRFVQPGDQGLAAASGRAVATFSWNPTTDQVDFAGEVPPEGVG